MFIREGYAKGPDSTVHVVSFEGPNGLRMLCGYTVPGARGYELYDEERLDRGMRRVCSGCKYTDFKRRGLL